MSQRTFKIAIIGAGPAGCMLACLLSESTPPPNTIIDITIFEGSAREYIPLERCSVKLHPRSGLAAIKAGGLYDGYFSRLERSDGSALCVCDKDHKTWFRAKASMEGDHEIDQSKLRNFLYNTFHRDKVRHEEIDGELMIRNVRTQGELVRWRSRLVRVVEEEPEEGKSYGLPMLHFGSGEVIGGWDLVVGADGGWSVTRRYLDPSQEPRYSGISKYVFNIPASSNNLDWASPLVKGGSLFAFGEGKSISAQKLGDGSLNVGAFLRFDSPPLSQSLTKNQILTQFQSWSPVLMRLIQSGQSVPQVYHLHQLPEDFRWNHRPGVTLVGDAAHLMTPTVLLFAGESVNLAFEDAWKLSQAILSGIPVGKRWIVTAS
ncbi:uncharacterized protein L3040_009420 [Drepanopeziza brunnea f. sp. 'multigermtubi']|uniref:uncharacterized protein n=1 Tax=Drepanopeziza brunnea f. sp. 'multigermtubi' TaxID=698441 RepID=UPI002389A189|nr:hypothetical protein L3040_009420 [Drepanopeziza brunnea f. sp. 'multigermtubi']